MYEALGGFSRRTIFNEDMILAGQMVQAGYKVAYAAEARVIHSHNYSGLQQFHRNFDLAVSLSLIHISSCSDRCAGNYILIYSGVVPQVQERHL